MPLNQQNLLAQLESQTSNFKQTIQQHHDDLERAVSQYRQTDREHWLSLEELGRGKQAGAWPVEALSHLRKVGTAPESYVVVATDGSAIPADRHGGMARYQVINIGEVVLGYGASQQCLIDSNTRLYRIEEGEGQTNSDNTESDQEEYLLSSSQILEVRGSVDELAVALQLAQQYQATLVLRDGPLTLWASSILNSAEGKTLTREYLNLLDRFAALAIPIVGYISNTRSDVVITALRQMANPQAYKGLLDAELFWEVLEVGECSPAFRNSARHPKDTAQTEQIYFMYLKTEREIVRLEFEKSFLGTFGLEMALAIIGRQLELGQGYPVALMEAHESAVLRGSDRELLRLLLEDYGLLGQESQKGLSKRLRGV